MAPPPMRRSPTGVALPLAGGPIAFTAAELIEGAPGSAETAHLHRAALWRTRATPISPHCSSGSRRQRPPFAGLALDRPVLMGIVNVTPDSFSDGGLYDSNEEAIAHAAELAGAGAAIVDIGGESTRPGSDPIEAGQEAHARPAGDRGAQRARAP